MSQRAPAPLGLVSQVQDDPPLLNWIYVDKDTMELKYGNKSASIEHHIGPWDWTEDEEQVVFDDMEAAYINAFYAVERLPGRWQLFFDFEGNQLATKLPGKLKRVQVELRRGMIVTADDLPQAEEKAESTTGKSDTTASAGTSTTGQSVKSSANSRIQSNITSY